MQHAIVRSDDASFNEVLEFTHRARPRMCNECIHCCFPVFVQCASPFAGRIPRRNEGPTGVCPLGALARVEARPERRSADSKDHCGCANASALSGLFRRRLKESSKLGITVASDRVKLGTLMWSNSSPTERFAHRGGNHSHFRSWSGNAGAGVFSLQPHIAGTEQGNWYNTL